MKQETQTHVVRTVDLLREHALRALEAGDVLLTAVQQQTASMSWHDLASSRETARSLRVLNGAARWVSAIGIVEPAGHMVQLTAAPVESLRIDVSDRDYFRAHQGLGGLLLGNWVGETSAGRVDGTGIFPVSRARLRVDGTPDGGVLLVAFRTVDFATYYATVAEGSSDVVMLLRDDGAVLAHHPALYPEFGQKLSSTAPPMLALRRASETSVTHPLGDSLNLFGSDEVLYTARQIPGHPLSVMYGLHPSVPRTAWLQRLTSIGAIAGAAALLLLWLTWYVQRRAFGERDALAQARREAERREQAEAAMREGQRFELLGQLAAGVAHDFRNVVQAVQSGARLIQNAATRDPGRVHALAEMVSDAAGRGTELTQRMLGFARGGAGIAAGHEPTTMPALAVDTACSLIRAALGLKYQIQCKVDAGLPKLVRGNRAELEAALINLAINARDAMPDGGNVSIMADPEDDPTSLPPGRYARISVVDTGAGMDQLVLARATDPFFTTKPRGKGTGLGLATARTFVEEIGGRLFITSAPGEGTTVTLWLPAYADGAE
ncbi:ATP-binding protein [Muricoccus vinaceus]|uniref:histidine kinase n=1 Tax=Muricoccus vinaceus TaxID=424704 RepID=A0ABV6ITS2_9PROT